MITLFFRRSADHETMEQRQTCSMSLSVGEGSQGTILSRRTHSGMLSSEWA